MASDQTLYAVVIIVSRMNWTIEEPSVYGFFNVTWNRRRRGIPPSWNRQRMTNPAVIKYYNLVAWPERSECFTIAYNRLEGLASIVEGSVPGVIQDCVL